MDQWKCPKCSSAPLTEVTVGLDGGSAVCSGVVRKGRKRLPCGTHFHWCSVTGQCIEGAPIHGKQPVKVDGMLDTIHRFIDDAQQLIDSSKELKDEQAIQQFVVKHHTLLAMQLGQLDLPNHMSGFDPQNRFIHQATPLLAIVQEVMVMSRRKFK